MTRQRMKAAVYDAAGGPEVLCYTCVDMPPCGPDQVLVRVGAISIEGGDLLHRANLAPEAPNHIVGFAAAGEIVEVGSAVTDRRVGQRVATRGAGRFPCRVPRRARQRHLDRPGWR
jgi:NADPH:quinone reductase-like Zn-dependent oxidoreductase